MGGTKRNRKYRKRRTLKRIRHTGGNQIYISGEAFKNICKYNLDDRYIIKEIDSTLEENDTVFLKQDDIDSFINSKPSKKVRLIVHNTDETFDDSCMNRIKPYVSKVYAVNSSAKDAIQLPLGFRDDQYTPHNVLDKVKGRGEKERDILCLLNFSIGKGNNERSNARDSFIGKQWCVIDTNENPGLHLDHKNNETIILREEFYTKLTKTKFVICPFGAGKDTHRVYEALFFGAIPIIKKSFLDEMYKKLGECWIVNDWSEVTEDECNRRWNAGGFKPFKNSVSEWLSMSGGGSNMNTRTVSFITYGNDAFKQSKERIVNEAKDAGCFNGQIKAYGPDDLSKEFLEKVAGVISMPRGGGYWIWKPYVIYDMLNQLNDNDILVYADSGCTIQKSAINRFNEYINMISPETPYCVLGMRLRANNRDGSLKNISLKQKTWTTNKIFEYFHINSDSDIANKEQIIATVIISRKSPESLAIFKKWLNVAEEQPELFSDKYNEETKMKNPHFSDNRHDQSIYTMIVQTAPYNKSVKIINEETEDVVNDNMFFLSSRKRQGGGSRRNKRKYNRIYTKRKRVISGGNHIKEENECLYISPRGVLKSCDIYSKELYDTNFSGYHNMQNIKDGNTIYVRSDNLKAFVEYFNKINNRIILIVGDSDYIFPKDLWDTNDSFIKFIENPNIIHIFAINVNTTHPKLTQYPIGLNYSILMEKGTEWGSKMSGEEQDLQLEEIHKKSLPFSERIIKCYSNFHFNMQLNRVYTQDRRDAKEQIPAECIYYEPKQMLRKDTYINQTKYAFVVCPHGNGLDCYRQWEALVLGCIPVVKTSSIDVLYDNLPVLIVKDWRDITMELLNSTIDKFKGRKFNYDKLKLKYLMNSINKYKVISGGEHPIVNRSIFARMEGGLGNHLFIYAAALLVKNKLNLPLYLIRVDNPHSNTDYITELFKEGKVYTGSDLDMRLAKAQVLFDNLNKTNPFSNFKNTNISYDNKSDVYLKYTYYQNYESIKSIIPKIKSDLIQIFKIKYPQLNSEFNTISNSSAFMHIRRGDYDKLILPAKYYQDALDLLAKNDKIKYIHILSDDIKWCKEHQWNKHEKEFRFIENTDELYAMYLMSFCLAGAIISGSTFSTWGVFLGAYQNKDATIIYPSQWMKYKSNVLKLPKEWIRLEINP